jgi:hypothetical protein
MGADAERGEAPPDVMPTPSAHDASVESDSRAPLRSRG